MDAGQCPLGSVELYLVPAGYDDRVSPLKKLLRQFEADAARSTGYQDSPLLKLHVRPHAFD